MAEPENLPGAGAYYTRLSIGPYRKGDAFKQAEFSTNLVVNLPLPTEMRDDTSVSYTNVNLETVGDIFTQTGEGSTDRIVNAAVLRNIGNLTSAGLSATGSAFNKALQGRSEVLGALTGAFMNTVQSLLPAEQVSSALQQKYGAAPNPNPSVQFQGPVLRDFTLTWAFYPKNQSESEKIDTLIRRLKGRALPSNNDGNNGTVLNYPHVCQLNFFPWDEPAGDGGTAHPNGWTDKSIIKIKKCFMSGVNVNYNAFGTPGFFEGTKLPISYQLTINFKEIEYLLSDDWDPSAAAERAVARVQAGEVAKTAADLVLTTGAAIVLGTFNAVKELILDEVPNQGEVDAEAAGLEAISKLESGNPDSYVEFTVPIQEQGLSGTTKYRAVRNAEGKFVLTPTSTRRFTDPEGPNTETTTTGEPRTFDTEAEMQEFLRGENVYSGGELTYPPQEDPATEGQ